MNLRSYLKFGILLIAAVVLSMTTFVLGGIPMRVVRKVYGRLPFWAAFALVAALLALVGLPVYALLVFALAVVVGVYADVEEHGGSVFTAAFVGVLTAIGSAAFSGGLWLHQAKIHLLDEVKKLLAGFEPGAAMGNMGISINQETFIQQLPSMTVIGLIVALGLALIFERRLLFWVGSPKDESIEGASKFSTFRIPDVFVWLTIAAIFGAFFKHGNSLIEMISINSLNVLAVMFFFQGLMIVAQAFRVFKVAPFWRNLWYIVFVFQLFFLVSLIGFADFWIEFRERLTRKPATQNKSF